MPTIAELNQRIWYRILKVLYFVGYVPAIIIAFLGFCEYGNEYHPQVLPATGQEAARDPNFYKISDDEKRYALDLIDPEFQDLPLKDKLDVIQSLNEKYGKFFKEGEKVHSEPKIQALLDRHKLPEKNYVYVGYNTTNVLSGLVFILIAVPINILFMELLRHTFYYVVIGEFFPKN